MLLNVCLLVLRLLFLNIYQKHKYGMGAVRISAPCKLNFSLVLP